MAGGTLCQTETSQRNQLADNYQYRRMPYHGTELILNHGHTEPMTRTQSHDCRGRGTELKGLALCHLSTRGRRQSQRAGCPRSHPNRSKATHVQLGGKGPE